MRTLLIAVGCSLLSLLLMGPARAADLEGWVAGPDGKPVANAKVYGTSPVAGDRTGRQPPQIRTAVTNARGRFLLKGLQWPLPDKRWEQHHLLAVAPGYSLGGTTWMPQEPRMAGPVVIHLAPAARWHAVVTDARGKPVVGCPLTLQWVMLNFTGKPMPRERSMEMERPSTDPSKPPPFQEVMTYEFESLLPLKTDGKGQVSFPLAPRDGMMSVIITHGDYATLHQWDVRTDGKKPTRFALQPGSRIEGRVIIAKTGQPRAGVRIGAQGTGMARGWGEAVTDADGRYAIRNLEPAEYNVCVDAPDNSEWTAVAKDRLKVGLGEQVKDTNFELVEGGFVAGVLKDAQTGKPLVGAAIAFYGQSRPKSGAWCEGTTTDAEGRYRYRLPAGRNYVYYQGGLEGYPYRQEPPGQARWVEVTDGRTTQADFILAKGPEEALPGSPAPAKPAAKKEVVIQPGEYHLKWVTMDASQGGRLSIADAELAVAETRPECITAEPPAAGPRRYATIRLGEPLRPFGVILERTQEKAKSYDTLYVDTDGDGDLSRERKVMADPQYVIGQKGGMVEWVHFAPVEIRCPYGAETRPLPVQVTVQPDREEKGLAFYYRLAGYWTGEVATDKGPMKVMLADMAHQGRFGRRSGAQGSSRTEGQPAILYLDRTLTGKMEFG